ncbi:2-amino-4-hydroxy-6-hydroxymethyldihydropteridine diphosphokinase [Myceligenerans sp. I2]|uniref:2-amino-4-hydroxy-6-hydroxymethyldihydropteridine diphosphokinase n=1 Tax=Myceligenerans indicum TaxID=2593663 RepID=A0ABS1LQ69_9MICO|nr:2-amino-4-hydroxy-6-hydroxymethyldihydropteridine diphosphokinase [Myceligenerans indicum]
MVPEITPAAGFEAQPSAFVPDVQTGEQAGVPDHEPAAPEVDPVGTYPQDGGLIDGIPPTEQAAPAFEPHADAPARPADDESTARRPAYAPGPDPAQASAFAPAPTGEDHAPDSAGAEQYEPEQYQGDQYQAEQYEPEQYQPEVGAYQPDFSQQPQAEQAQQVPYAEQAQQVPYAEQAQQVPYAEQAQQVAYADQAQQAAFAGGPQEAFAEQPGAVAQGQAPEDRLDEVPAEPVEVVLALGANLGDPQATLRAAVMDLDRIAGLQITDVSPLARTAAVGGPEQPDYLNAVVVARTSFAPRALLQACQAIEYAHGRTREEHWGPRTLDIDIITYGPLTAAADDLEVPHPRAHERAFVLEPWAQLDPDAVLPGLGGGPVAQLAATAEDRQGIRWLALDWLTESNSGADPTGDVEPQPTASHRPYDPPAQQQPAPPAQDQAPDQAFRQDRSHYDQLVQGGPGQPLQGPVDPYPQQVSPFRQQDSFQQPQDAARAAHPQGFGPDSGQQPQAQQSGAVPPPEEAMVPAPHVSAADHPAARAPHTPPAAPLVPSAVRETAHHELPAEQVPVDPGHPVFAPVRPQPGDVPFAPVNPVPNEQQRAQPADDRPAWAPVRSDEPGHRG